MASPIKVAIVGGGCAGVAAAFELSRPEHKGQFQVTLYQQGWRLGGKGASGRRPDGRIEEHGLHLWMGYYDNAFRLLRECYDELRAGGRPDYWTWRDAFRPVSAIGAQDKHGASWESWLAYFPFNDLTPGDPPEDWRPVAPLDYLRRGLELALSLLDSVESSDQKAGPTRPNSDLGELLTNLLGKGLPYSEAMSFVAVREALLFVRSLAAGVPLGPEVPAKLFGVLDVLQDELEGRIRRLGDADPGHRRTLALVEVVLANLRGMVRFGVVFSPQGFDAVDDYDYRDWLKLSGASDEALDSPIVRALYDLAFAYQDGDVNKPRLSAGQGLRSALRAFFTYRGALFWKMNAGMGDVVFAPFYEVLRARGVRFEFFHRLERVEMSRVEADAPHVAALHFDVQANVRGSADYEPLVSVGGLPCWPSSPDFAQLEDGDSMRREGWEFESFWDTRCMGQRSLGVSRDFDFVVLGIGLGAMPHTCAELISTDERWREMVAHVKTIPTRALQLWLTPDLDGLGWHHGSFDVSGFAEPFDTWADMTHLVHAEGQAVKPGNITYFCSVLPDEEPVPPRSERDYLQRRNLGVRSDALRFLKHEVRHIWPDAVDEEGCFRWGLIAGSEKCAPEALDSQYWKANINPTDRYTLALPGSTRYRISPLDRTYDNLTIAGDWTDCGLNVGCVEAAFMSGRLAAHALSSSPPLEQIVGFDHP